MGLARHPTLVVLGGCWRWGLTQELAEAEVHIRPKIAVVEGAGENGDCSGRGMVGKIPWAKAPAGDSGAGAQKA